MKSGIIRGLGSRKESGYITVSVRDRFRVAKELAVLDDKQLLEYIKFHVARGRFEYGPKTGEERDLINWRLAVREAGKRGISKEQISAAWMEGDKMGIRRATGKESV